MRQLLLVDGLASEVQDLVKRAKLESLCLGVSPDPISWISSLLNRRKEEGQQIEELHLLAHGSAEGIELGGQKVDHGALLNKAKELSNWQNEKLVVWSCEIGANQPLIQQLSAYTKAEVFSSQQQINRDNAWLHSDQGQSIHASERY